MTRSCLDNAILLKSIASRDDLDDRCAGAPLHSELTDYPGTLPFAMKDGRYQHVHPVGSLVVIPADSGNVFATRATDIEETTNQAEQNSSALLSSSAATSHSAVSEATITSPYSTQKSTHTIQDVGSPVLIFALPLDDEDVNEIEENFEQGLKTEKHSDSRPGWSALRSGSLSKSDSRRRSGLFKVLPKKDNIKTEDLKGNVAAVEL
ncbi:hypothetical protein F5050DRAFT_1808839 [Lentinula boryana]|uniref:Uncharacterized protein n=1 Tax=Lentinula boryana TaxID=40481 RepID=A0ABQ8Q9T7_9AGAR|nr:hypothetical protein F5050DRAFT_1808839 [Lentinula boryana]